MSAIQDIKNSSLNVQHLSGKKQLDLIINHPAPLKVVREMPTQNLLMIIRDVGAESSLELVEMMHPQQIQELFDLEVWHKDALNPRALGHYFSLLFEANPDTAVSQIYHLDIELIGVMFKMASTICDLSLGEEPYDYPELFSTSPGGRFLVCFSDDKTLGGLPQMLHTFLESLYGRDLPFALRLLENLRYEVVSGLEEQSLRCRQNRLMEFGILPSEERLEYFSTLTTNDIKRVREAALRDVRHDIPSLMPITNFDAHADDNYPFLKRALSECSDAAKNNFLPSLVHASANMHASLSGDFGDVDVMMATSHYIKFLAEAGLFQACHGRLDKAAQALEHYPAKFLIRLGRTALINIRKRLTTNLKDPAFVFGTEFCHLDSPLREVARAICLAEPRFYEGLASAKELTVRYFANLNEVNMTLAAVNEILFRARFVGEGLGFTERELARVPSLSHANILARVMINAFLNREDRLCDIVFNDVQHVFAGSDLTSQMNEFATTFVTTHAQRLAVAWGESEAELVEKAHHFRNAVLIQLTQNRALILG